jgi:hypothetical protein
MLQVSPHHQALEELRADAQTDSFRRLYRARAPVIEGVFAEGKQWHGLRRAWRRGLSNMLIQSLLIAAVLNFKRLLATMGRIPGLRCFLRALHNHLRALRRITGMIHEHLALSTRLGVIVAR